MLHARCTILYPFVRRHIVKSNYLTPVAIAALLFGSAIANAQTASDPSAHQPSMLPTSLWVMTKGYDLVSHNTIGMQQAVAPRPGFDTFDSKGTGFLTADEVKGNGWLSKNFARCDTDHDGQLSREEFGDCRQ
jgi:hypothetical protein